MIIIKVVMDVLVAAVNDFSCSEKMRRLSVFWNWYCFIMLVSNDFFYLDQFVKHLFIQFLESVLILPLATHNVEIADIYSSHFFPKIA